MKAIAASCALILCGCNTLPWPRQPAASDAACTASCDAHFEQCPKIFAGFPGRADSECPAEHDICIRSCATRPAAAVAAVPPAAAGSVQPPSSKELRLRELKHLYEEGLVTEEVYRARQTAILAEP
jgi:hypothetical protein